MAAHAKLHLLLPVFFVLDLAWIPLGADTLHQRHVRRLLAHRPDLCHHIPPTGHRFARRLRRGNA